MGNPSGGATGYSSVPNFVSDVNSLMLRGRTSGTDVVNWETETESGVYAGSVGGAGEYADNPSALRFLIERGLSDVGGNPFEGVSAYDPSGDLGDAKDAFDRFVAAVDAFDPQSNWTEFFDAATSKAAELLPDVDRDTLLLEAVNRADVKKVVQAAADAIETGALDGSVEDYRRRALRQHLRGVNRFAGGMADANAVHSSAYVIGLSLLEADFNDQVMGFREKASVGLISQALSLFMSSFEGLIRQKTQEQMARAAFSEGAVARLMAASAAMLQLEQGASTQNADLARMNIVSKVDEYGSNLEYDVKGASWDLELFQKVANIASATAGSVVPNAAQPTRAQSALGGAAAGASIGAMLPGASPVTALAGGVLGGIAGYLAA